MLLYFPALAEQFLKAYIHGHYRLNPKTGQRIWIESHQDKRPERHRASFDNTAHRVTHFQHHLGRGQTREAMQSFHDLGHDDAHQLARHLGLAGEEKGQDKKALMESIYSRVQERKQAAMHDPNAKIEKKAKRAGAKKPAPTAPAAEKPAATARAEAPKPATGASPPPTEKPTSDQPDLAHSKAMAPFEADYPMHGRMTVKPLNPPDLRPGHTLVDVGFRRIKATLSNSDQAHWRVSPVADWYRYGVARNEHGQLYGFAEYPKHYQQRGRDLILTFEDMGTSPLEDGRMFRGLHSAIADLYQHHARAERQGDLL